MLLTLEERKKVAAVLNTRIDIPWVPEGVEATILEHAIGLVDSALEDVLPEAFGNLMRDGTQGIDEAEARAFGDRLVQAVNKRVDLPYLDEAQEASFVKMMIDPLVKAMIDGETINDVLERVKQRLDDKVQGQDEGTS